MLSIQLAAFKEGVYNQLITFKPEELGYI